MNVVDSSAWIEYFTAGPNAAIFAKPIEATRDLIVPSLTIFEVFKRVLQQRGETTAVEHVAHMMQGRVVDLDSNLALSAAKIALDRRLAMADAIILATARANNAVLWTQDAHFDGIENIQFHPKRGTRAG